MKKQFREIRLHSDKAPQEFLCELVHQEETYVVLRYRSPESYAFGPAAIEKGTLTIAHYWSDRNHILWILNKPDDALIGHLFHIARNVEIGKDYVRYVDLELDIWFNPDGNPTVLDQEEVNDYYTKGIFDDRTRSLIEEQKINILNNYHAIIRDVWPGKEPT
jgi:hypothetical protein